MAEWSDEEVLQFISYYEQMTLLWYPKHPCHFNKIRRNDAWVDIALKTGKSMEECKRKMSSLLSSMRREKSKMKKSIGTGKGTDEVYESPWFAFKSMQFLWDKNKPRETTSTVVLQTADDTDDDKPVIMNGESSSSRNQSEKRKFNFPDASEPNKSEKRPKNLDCKVPALDKHGGNPSKTVHVKKMYYLDHFAKYIAHILGELPPYRSLRLQQHIMNLVLKEQMAALNDPSHPEMESRSPVSEESNYTMSDDDT